MTRAMFWTAASASILALMASTAQAQPIYGGFHGGYWGGGYGGGGYGGGGQTVQGSIAQGMGVYAAGAGAYNEQTAVARSINANTTMQFNQYVYQSKKESERIYHEKMARDKSRNEQGAAAVRARLRDNPNAIDIAKGDALNVALDEMSNPKVFPKAVYYGHKVKIGGELIRDIPFASGANAISISVNQLTKGGAPEALKTRPEFESDRTALRAIAAELRQQGEETGTHKPETIQKAKDQLLATRSKIEATFPKNTPDRVASEKYIKALYGFVRMLETPAVGVLLAGVEKHPDATLGDLLGFMNDFNLRFGAAVSPRQKEVYQKLYPLMVQVRSQVSPTAGDEAPAPEVGHDAPMAIFEGMSYDQLEGKAPPKPATQPR